MIKKSVLFFALLLITVELVDAQSFYSRRRDRNFVITGGTGAATYFGDLVDDGQFRTRFNTTIGLRYRFWNRFAVSGDVTWFFISGDDADTEGKTGRNLSFQSNNFEVAGTIHIDFFKTPERFYQRKFINPYVFFGAGLMQYNPTTLSDAGERVALRPLQTEGVEYSIFTPVFPVGFGLKFRFTPFLNLALDGGYRHTLTDYLDDVSDSYPGQAFFESGDYNGSDASLAFELSDRTEGTPKEAGAQRGNPDNNDTYFLFTAKVEYYIPTLFQKKSRYKKRRGGGLFSGNKSKRRSAPMKRQKQRVRRR